MLCERFKDISDQGYAIGITNSDEPHLNYVTTYSSTWEDEYFSLNGPVNDPVCILGRRKSGLQQLDNTKPTTVFMQAAFDHHIKKAIVYSDVIAGSKLYAGISLKSGLTEIDLNVIKDSLREYHLNQLQERVSHLSTTQKNLIMLSAQGFRAKEIAHHFNVSEAAIKQRKRKIQQTIGVNNFACVIALAARAGYAFHPISQM